MPAMQVLELDLGPKVSRVFGELMQQLSALILPAQDREPDLAITLPWPPSVNRKDRQYAIPPALDRIKQQLRDYGWQGFYQWLRRATKIGGARGKDVETYIEAAAWLLKAARVQFGTDDVAAWLVICPPTTRKPDMDNRLKMVFDAAQWARVVNNDNQFADFRVTRGGKTQDGAVDVRMWRL